MKIVGVFPLDVAVLAAIVAVSSTVRVRGSSFVETERNLGKSSKTSTSHDSDEGWNQYSPGPGWYGGHFHGHYPPWGGGSHSGWYGSGHDGWHGGHESESHSTSGKSGKGSKRSGGKSSKSSNSKSSKGSSSKSSKSSSSSSSEEGGHWVWVEYSHHHGHSHGWSDDGWSGSDYSGKSGKSGSGKSGKSGSGSGKSGKSDSGGSGSSVDWSDVDWSDDGWSDEDEEATSHHHVPYDGYAWKGDEWYGHHYDHNNYGYYGNGGIDNHVTDICHASCEGDVCTYHMKVNLYQSEFGFFTFEECDPDLFMPTIALELGKTYRFIQSERTNYFHPVGFAYAPDGVFLDNPEIDEFTAPPGTDNGCEESNSCPTARYFLNDDEIGLGMYEPMMAHPIHEWANYGTFYAEFNFPEGTGYEQDLFYFCHLHQYLGGRIKLLKNGKPIQPHSHLPIHTVYLKPPSSYDLQCGTYGLDDFQLPHPECPHRFVCNDVETDNISQFAGCIESMNCHMFAKMSAKATTGSEIALFIHEMIPHHQNAVNMAKSLLKLWEEKCYNIGSDETDDCIMEGMLREIINAQNAQIQVMREILRGNEWPEWDDCKVTVDIHQAGGEKGENSYRQRALELFPSVSSSSTSLRAEKPSGVFMHASSPNVERLASEDAICRAHCYEKNGKEICQFTVAVDLFATELGAFIFKECGDEIYPTIGMEIGKTYIFVQEDISNYYHPLGFAYFADGAHDDKDEIEDVVVPPGSSSTCDTDASCPSPRYFIDKENVGLDGYEPKFFHSPGEWIEYGTFYAELNFDIEDYGKDLFYFCHIHQFMSGRIKLLKNDKPIQYQDSPEMPYVHGYPSEYDRQCGSFGLEEFQLPHPECPHKFICDADSSSNMSKFADCIDTQNCFMMTGMTTYVYDEDGGDVALFNHHMIPHHENAVNMAKSLLKLGSLNCSKLTDDTDDCRMETIVREIINNQNYQIQLMKGILERDGFPETNDCTVLVSKHGNT